MPSYPFSLRRQKLPVFPIWPHFQVNDMHRNTALSYMEDQYKLNLQQFFSLKHSNPYCNIYSFYYSLCLLPVIITLNAYQILHLCDMHHNDHTSSLFCPLRKEVKLLIRLFPSHLFLYLHT